MDFSAFSGENFNVKEWVNAILKSPEAASNTEAFASQHVMKLQLFIQEVNNALEDTSQQVLQNLPRVVRDTEMLKQEVLLLQSQMKAVRDDVEKVEHDTAQSMQTLLKVDKIKSRMQSASKALQEADNWTTLSADVEEVFQTGDFHAIAAKLQGMQQSLKILVDIPDYKDRCHHLENLKNSLEAMISPHLVTAINAQSVDTAQIYAKIFRDMERLPELKKYYHKCQKGQLVQKWREIVESDSDYTLLNWMAIYCDTLLSNWHIQMKWFSVVFPDLPAVTLLCDILCDTLSSLDPSVSFCLVSAIKQQPNPLAFLIDLKQIIERFAKSLASTIRAHNPGALLEASVQQLATTIFLPFKPHIIKYSSYEERFLLNQLETITFKTEDVADSISLLSESVMKVFGFAEEANNHCLQFSNGCCYFGLISALTAFFNAYIAKVRQSIVRWKDSLKLDDCSGSSANDWSFLQQTLHAVQVCGEIMLKLESLDQTLVSSFLSCVKQLGYLSNDEKKDVSVFSAMDDLLLDPNDRVALRKLSSKLIDESEPSLLSGIKQSQIKLCGTVSKIIFDVFFNEIRHRLSNLQDMNTWSLENPSGVLTLDLPTFGLSPQEYITQIGQYLMTVPLHIEPFSMQDNPAVRAGLKFGKLPHSTERDLVQGDHIADYLLSCIAARTCSTYADQVLRIAQVTTYGARQLATDIDYLCNVLDDLGIHPSDNLVAISDLLKAPAETYAAAADGKPAKIVSAIRGLRNLSLVEN